MQNSIVVFTFSVLHWKHPFWANLVHKIKIISLSWNLVPRLIWIYRIQWLYSLFLFFRLETPFLGKLFQKIKFVSLSWNLVPRLVRICRIKWWFSLFLFYTGKKLFWQTKITKRYCYCLCEHMGVNRQVLTTEFFYFVVVCFCQLP